MTRNVTASSDIQPSRLPEPIADHRIDYWRWVELHADTASRDKLLGLRDHWRDCNIRYFDGRMVEPYITLTEPSAPQVYGQCCWDSSWGSRLEIKLRPSLLDGTHPHLRDGDPAGRWQFVKDVLLHEIIHQHVMEHQPGVDESSYKGHGPVFTAHCNRIGAQLGLPEVVVRNRRGTELPKAPQWPHCVAPPERYLGAYRKRRAAVTARGVIVPPGYYASAITPVATGKNVMLSIEFESAGLAVDDPTIQLRIDPDTALQLADSIIDYLGDDDEAYQ